MYLCTQFIPDQLQAKLQGPSSGKPTNYIFVKIVTFDDNCDLLVKIVTFGQNGYKVYVLASCFTYYLSWAS